MPDSGDDSDASSDESLLYFRVPGVKNGSVKMSRFLDRVLRAAPLAGTVAVAAALIGGCSSSTPASAAPPDGVRPTVVLVHGAWADTSSWDGEVSALMEHGYDVRAIANPLENLTTDSEYVSAFLNTIPGPIVLVGHSYGGSVITNAAAGNPNVKALVYVDAAAPAVGETNGSLSGSDSVLKHKPESELFDKLSYPGAAGAVDLYLKKDIFLHYFGNDLPTDEATRLWATQRAASTSAFETPSKFAAWKTIPSWYFISSGDQIITPTSEHAMAERAGSHVTVFDGGSHLTLISHPDAVTAVIQQAIDSVQK
jgi:pimeloyl-ACP methyl ester carboxylesterase